MGDLRTRTNRPGEHQAALDPRLNNAAELNELQRNRIGASKDEDGKAVTPALNDGFVFLAPTKPQSNDMRKP